MQKLDNDTLIMKEVSTLEQVKRGDEVFYKISDTDAMRPFL